MNLKIRPAKIDDAGAISSLILGVAHYFLVEPTGQDAENFYRTVSAEAIASYLSNNSFNYLIGEVGDELAGVIGIKENRHIYHLFVASKFQKQGVAAALWEKAKSMALAAGNPGWFTLNSTPYAVPVYERFGFKPTGPKVEKYGVAFVPMELEL